MNIVILIILCIYVSLSFTYIDYKMHYDCALTSKIGSTSLIAFLSYNCYTLNLNCNKSYFILIFLGIIFGLIGDILLALRKMYIETDKIYFLGGLGAFLIGHIFYIKAFSLINCINKYDFIFTAIYLIFVFFMIKKSKLNFNGLQFPVIIYTVVISFVLGKATSILFLTNNILNKVVFIGILLFVISDIFLTFDIFGEKKNKLLTVYCHFFYFPAQILIALSIMYANGL